MPHTAPLPLESCVAPVESLTRTPSRRLTRLALVALLAALAPGCIEHPGAALRTVWLEEGRPEAWRPVEVESAVRVGARGDWWVRVRMHDGRRVDDVIAPWSRSQGNRTWVMPHPQSLGNHPEIMRTPPPGGLPVATRGPDVPRIELRDLGDAYVSDGLFLVQVEGDPGEELGHYGHVPGTSGTRWRRDRVWFRVLLTTPAAVVDAALFILNIPYYVLMPRGFHT